MDALPRPINHLTQRNTFSGFRFLTMSGGYFVSTANRSARIGCCAGQAENCNGAVSIRRLSASARNDVSEREFAARKNAMVACSSHRLTVSSILQSISNRSPSLAWRPQKWWWWSTQQRAPSLRFQ